jgi:phosphopantothenoylcysteine decarboxylase/phosphopantothenate--cysteine ligase, prokaryotic
MKKIIVGVSGSIAAYKTATLVRALIKKGCEVKVVMTESATQFIAPLTLSTLSKHPVYTDIIDGDQWSNHVELGLWADLMIIAPATASTISKMAHGLCDNMLIAAYLSAKCPVYIAPAMDLDMWIHPSTTANINLLKSYDNKIIPVGHGELASGLVGAGRMAEPEEIVDFVLGDASTDRDLVGQKVLITAGPTKESVDPVRFLSNHSSGRMGIALADECYSRGAEVHLILGPTQLKPRHPSVNISHVISAQDMYEACQVHFKDLSIAIFAAAVADYTPDRYSDDKMKKSDDDLALALKRTIDIAGTFGQKKSPTQISVGFALETSNGEDHANGKLHKKNFNLIVLNSLREEGAGFQHDTNKIKILDTKGTITSYELKPKTAVAHDVIDAVVLHLRN